MLDREWFGEVFVGVRIDGRICLECHVAFVTMLCLHRGLMVATRPSMNTLAQLFLTVNSRLGFASRQMHDAAEFLFKFFVRFPGLDAKFKRTAIRMYWCAECLKRGVTDDEALLDPEIALEA